MYIYKYIYMCENLLEIQIVCKNADFFGFSLKIW